MSLSKTNFTVFDSVTLTEKTLGCNPGEIGIVSRTSGNMTEVEFWNGMTLIVPSEKLKLTSEIQSSKIEQIKVNV